MSVQINNWPLLNTFLSWFSTQKVCHNFASTCYHKKSSQCLLHRSPVPNKRNPFMWKLTQINSWYETHKSLPLSLPNFTLIRPFCNKSLLHFLGARILVQNCKNSFEFKCCKNRWSVTWRTQHNFSSTFSSENFCFETLLQSGTLILPNTFWSETAASAFESLALTHTRASSSTPVKQKLNASVFTF